MIAISADILIVEDDPLSGRTLAAILRTSGHEVELVTSVQAGLERLLSNPRCVLLDLMLPDGDGALILARIRASRLRTRVAVITSMVEPERFEVLRDLGADRVFAKPVNADELMRWISETATIPPQKSCDIDQSRHQSY
ncbi:MAG: response regulator transcription factor [Anaerolineae bacterium]|nr:response regulator transcription factor [Phycisphaerae bacterium]